MSVGGPAVVTALVCAVLCALACLAVPRVLAALPSLPATAVAEPEPPGPARLAGLGARCALAGAVAGVLLAVGAGPQPWLAVLVVLVPVGVALAVVDARTRTLPRVLVLPATGAVVVAAVAGWAVGGPADDLLRTLAGLVVTRSAFWLLWRVHPAGLGFGDVRLAALLGAALGHLGWAELLVGLYAGFLLLGVPGALRALARRDAGLLRTAYPFGPSLLAGAVLGVLLGAPAARALGGG